MVCPAYQSAFIYDKEELRKKFSYFQDDSTPKVLTASKSKFLIAEETSYKKKMRSLQTVPLKPVNVVLPDSLDPDFEEGEDGVFVGAEMDLAARSVIDSTFIVDVEQDTLEVEEDSVYVISKDKEVRLLKYNMPDSLKFDPASGKYVKETPSYYITEVRFNVEQDNYMWYLRDYLMLPDVRLAKIGAGQKAEEEKKATKKKGGFFKRLFGKKDKKAATDSTAVKPESLQQDEDDFDYVDEDEQLKDPAQTATEPEKKGLFKKKQKSTTETTDTAAPAKKKKEKKSKDAQKQDVEPVEEEKPTEEEDEDGF